MKNLGHIALILLAGFIGGVSGSFLFHPAPLWAAASQEKQVSVINKPTILYNADGKRIGYLGQGDDGQGTMFLFDKDGEVRIQMGTYTVFRERGQSMFALHDRKERLRLLFRLSGSYDSPTIIFKDMYGRDKIKIGLKGRGEVPYFEYVDKHEQVHDLLRQP